MIKDKAGVDLRFAFCFRYLRGRYVVLGMKILYELLNERPNWWCSALSCPGWI